MPDSLLALSLASCSGIGTGKTLGRVLTRNQLFGRSETEFLALGEHALIEEYSLKRPLAEKWVAGRCVFLDQGRALADRLSSLGIHPITVADDDFPAQLETFGADPPSLLFAYGNRRLLKTKSFAIMASRNAPPAALEAIERLAEEGVLGGEVLVSSHNTPEYRRAAVVPLRWGAPRILVFDEELSGALGKDLSSEPFPAARLWRHQFDASTDLAISAILPDHDKHGGSNRKRDLLVAGLSRRIDFAFIQMGRNMESLARKAIHSGRIVRVADTFPGSREWERYGATMIPD